MHSWIWSFLSAVFVLTLNPYYSPLWGEPKWDISETELFSPSKDLLAASKSNQCRWMSFFPFFSMQEKGKQNPVFLHTGKISERHLALSHTSVEESETALPMKSLAWQLGERITQTSTTIGPDLCLFHSTFSVALTLDFYPATARLIHHSD